MLIIIIIDNPIIIVCTHWAVNNYLVCLFLANTTHFSLKNCAMAWHEVLYGLINIKLKNSLSTCAFYQETKTSFILLCIRSVKNIFYLMTMHSKLNLKLNLWTPWVDLVLRNNVQQVSISDTCYIQRLCELMTYVILILGLTLTV